MPPISTPATVVPRGMPPPTQRECAEICKREDRDEGTGGNGQRPTVTVARGCELLGIGVTHKESPGGQGAVRSFESRGAGSTAIIGGDLELDDLTNHDVVITRADGSRSVRHSSEARAPSIHATR